MADLSYLTFDELLDQYFADATVEAELWRRHGSAGAVLVVDFTAMARHTEERGIAYALALARRSQRAILPALGAGTLVKHVADTLFYVFPAAPEALIAALDAQRLLPDGPIRACMGLGFGRFLLVPGQDAFGPEVNRAFVLGEDVARGGEVLATPAFLDALGEPPVGVGAHRAPEEREAEARFAFHVLADYRE